ncbi:MAG: DAK2 domain-containing protein [Candidatus Cohnella colombiensis]|uniref:DAK2 domain-containing protein n=1 Tax=Candidatus Cohnella colombiensis TaxID=3121368 RepID=A0AA95JHE0_9BACL|nr:MAG: DAK2 domain-containing protein [Cohnella sp.]
MIVSGAEKLSHNAERVNALNVFPVPDGDTGTNMNLTMSAGVVELMKKPTDDVGRAAEVLSKGLLMGARGNSGVILSQLFRGFSRAVAGQQVLTVPLFANALQQGVDTAYKAVVKPVEGTILTVAREAARHGVQASRRIADIVEWMHEVYDKASETLALTQEMLPILKQVGVVDSGGQGLVYIYEGFLNYLNGAVDVKSPSTNRSSAAPFGLAKAVPTNAPAQAKISTESIMFPYDMEFFIQRTATSVSYSERSFRQVLERDGDSIILIDDDDIIKVHVHSRRPGDVLNAALPYGNITDIHILNMQEQHKDLLQSNDSQAHVPELQPMVDYSLPGVAALPGVTASPESVPNPDVYEMAAYGVVVVSVGEGNAELFRSLGVDIVISGGQSMNPSTEDLLSAISSLSAHHVYLLPNNPNVILAAKQAAELTDRAVTVVPTRTIPQGMAAMLAFHENESESSNLARMTKASEQVVTGQITLAVRDTVMDGIDIKEGQYIGIKDKTIVVSTSSILSTCEQLIAGLLADGGDMITVLTGEDADSVQTKQLEDWITEQYPDIEVEIHVGGQPLYPYLFAVES